LGKVGVYPKEASFRYSTLWASGHPTNIRIGCKDLPRKMYLPMKKICKLQKKEVFQHWA